VFYEQINDDDDDDDDDEFDETFSSSEVYPGRSD